MERVYPQSGGDNAEHRRKVDRAVNSGRLPSVIINLDWYWGSSVESSLMGGKSRKVTLPVILCDDLGLPLGSPIVHGLLNLVAEALVLP